MTLKGSTRDWLILLVEKKNNTKAIEIRSYIDFLESEIKRLNHNKSISEVREIKETPSEWRDL